MEIMATAADNPSLYSYSTLAMYHRTHSYYQLVTSLKDCMQHTVVCHCIRNCVTNFIYIYIYQACTVEQELVATVGNK